MSKRALALSLVFAAGCSGGTSESVDGSAGSVDAAATPDATNIDAPAPDSSIDPTGTHYPFVIDRVSLPSSADEAQAFGFDLDGDEDIDNSLGNVIAILTGQGFDAQTNMTQMLDRGEIIYLASLLATSLEDATGVGFAIYLGDDPSKPPCTSASDTVCRRHFDGTTSFVIQAGSPTERLGGQISSGHLSAGPGGIPILIPISLDGPPILLHLVGARIGGDVAVSGIIGGRLGGAVTRAEVDTVLIPGIHDAIVTVVATDCPGGNCVPGTDGETLVNLFDTDGDGMVSLEELQGSILVQNLLAADLDLFDADGNFHPNSDGVKESLSLGVTFTAVTAFFYPPSD